MTPTMARRTVTRISRLVVGAAVTALTVGLSAVPAHAGWQNHNETLLGHGG